MSTGATGRDVVIVTVVVVVEVVVVVVVVVVDDPNFPFTQTRFPTRKNDSADAPFNRYNVGSPNPNRTASRDHESFGNAIWNFAHDLIGCQESDAKTAGGTDPQTTVATTKARIDRNMGFTVPKVCYFIQKVLNSLVW
jgi:hypothetical protein